MAMFPAVLNDTTFADLFDDPFFSTWGDPSTRVGALTAPLNMKTDVRENDGSYDVDIDMPAFKKDDIAIELHDGYLTVSAHKDESHADNDKGDNAKEGKSDSGRWLRRERYVGSCSRNFYVGDQVKESDIKASYRDGTLCLQIAKVQPEPQVETKHQIAIEG